MSSISVAGDISGSITIAAPAVSGSNTLTLPVATDTLVGKSTTDTLTNKTLGTPTITSPSISSAVMTTMASSVITSGTAVASTSGTSIDFTSIPSWVKRITVMFNQVSLSGTSGFLVQLGDAGGIETSGYTSTVLNDAGTITTNSTAGFVLVNAGAAAVTVWRGALTLSLVATNTFIGTASISRDSGAQYSSGAKALSDTITQIRLTTINGTDTFDAGSVNILYE